MLPLILKQGQRVCNICKEVFNMERRIFAKRKIVLILLKNICVRLIVFLIQDVQNFKNVVLHNNSNYNDYLIIRQLANEFAGGNFKYLGEDLKQLIKVLSIR